MYPAGGGLVWGQMRGLLSEVRGVYTPPRVVCIAYRPEGPLVDEDGGDEVLERREDGQP